jgi:xylan 1,4-beta-xylosidase
MFEVWNEPNGGNNPDAGFWTGWPKQETYFHLYKETADAFSRVSGAFKIGGPSTAGCPGWISALKTFAANSTPPTKLDFFSCHSYGGGKDPANVGDMGFIDSFRLAQHDSGGLPLVVTEWSSSWSFNVDFHDEPGSAAFLAAAIQKADGLTDMMSYWTFSVS